jgi:hypothetical protein
MDSHLLGNVLGALSLKQNADSLSVVCDLFCSLLKCFISFASLRRWIRSVSSLPPFACMAVVTSTELLRLQQPHLLLHRRVAMMPSPASRAPPSVHSLHYLDTRNVCIRIGIELALLLHIMMHVGLFYYFGSLLIYSLLICSFVCWYLRGYLHRHILPTVAGLSEDTLRLARKHSFLRLSEGRY